MLTSLPKIFKRVEFPVLAAGLCIAAGLWGFVELMEVARDSAPHSFDTSIMLAFRQAGHPDIPIGPFWLHGMMRDITSLGSTIIVLLTTMAVIVFLVLQRRLQTALFVFAAVAGGQFLSSILKLGIERPRPDLVSHLADVSTYSFPSGHAMLSAVTYLTLGSIAAQIVERRATRIFVLLLAVLTTFLVGISRIYLGVHWPSDVLAGWCAGFAWAMLWWLATRFLREHDTVRENLQ